MPSAAETPEMTSKLPDMGITIFAVMSQMAREHGALNLSQGFPDFDAPEGLRERVSYFMNAGNNQYAPMPGVPALREAIAEKLAAYYGRRADPESEITVTAGATESLLCAIHAAVRPGDEVIVFDPAYDSYEPAVELAGGRCVHLPLDPPDYRPDGDALAKAITPRTRLIILNTPHNPAGSVLRPEDLDALCELVRGTDIFLLSDEVYEHIVFDGQVHQSMLLREELAARAFTVFSFGKIYHATGWKVGYCVAPEPLTKEFRKVHQFVTFAVNTPVQMAIADFMTAEPEYPRELPGFYQQKRDRFCELIAPSRFTCKPAGGTYFQLLDYSAISNADDMTMARRMTTEIGVACVPLSPFCAAPQGERVLRFCFAKEDETLEKAAEILCSL